MQLSTAAAVLTASLMGIWSRRSDSGCCCCSCGEIAAFFMVVAAGGRFWQTVFLDFWIWQIVNEVNK